MRLVLAALAALAMLALALPATAHDSWISRGALRNPAGEWCCGEGDCGMLDRGAVRVTAGGYRIDGFVTIKGYSADYDGGSVSDVREEIHEIVPFNEAQPSPDGEYWRCKRPDGSRRCFFAPPPNM